MKDTVLLLFFLAIIVAPLVLFVRFGTETIANKVNNFVDWLTSFVPDWIKGK